jgi:hypothetical protein
MSKIKAIPATNCEGISDIIKVTTKIGDQCNDMWNASWDLNSAKTALSAYKTAISASKAQVQYKRLTSKPSKILFLEK